MITSRLARLTFVTLVLSGIGCGDEEEELNHGIVKLEFRRSEGMASDTSPFPGTARVSATMEYRECLVEYYMNNQDQRQDGVEGELVFGTKEQGGEGWIDRLCEYDVPSPVDCSVESITQELDTGPPKLTVVYNIEGDGNIENRNLAIGPFPDREHAGCMGEDLPEVRVGVAGVNGYNSSGAEIWETETTNPNDAVVDQGKAITIYASPPG